MRTVVHSLYFLCLTRWAVMFDHGASNPGYLVREETKLLYSRYRGGRQGSVKTKLLFIAHPHPRTESIFVLALVKQPGLAVPK